MPDADAYNHRQQPYVFDELQAVHSFQRIHLCFVGGKSDSDRANEMMLGDTEESKGMISLYT